MREKQVAKNQLINELTKLRQRFAKREKSETRHKQAEEERKKSFERIQRNLEETVHALASAHDAFIKCA